MRHPMSRNVRGVLRSRRLVRRRVYQRGSSGLRRGLHCLRPRVSPRVKSRQGQRGLYRLTSFDDASSLPRVGLSVGSAPLSFWIAQNALYVNSLSLREGVCSYYLLCSTRYLAQCDAVGTRNNCASLAAIQQFRKNTKSKCCSRFGWRVRLLDRTTGDRGVPRNVRDRHDQ